MDFGLSGLYIPITLAKHGKMIDTIQKLMIVHLAKYLSMNDETLLEKVIETAAFDSINDFNRSSADFGVHQDLDKSVALVSKVLADALSSNGFVA